MQLYRWFLAAFVVVFSYLQGENMEKAVQKKMVVFETTQGNITFELMPEVAPKACENFIGLVEKGYYNNTIFHRMIPGFMIQGGDPKGDGTGGSSIWGVNFEDEFSSQVLFDKEGLLAMANRGPKTNGSQFFITTAKTNWLNQRHTIFGKVTEGYDVVKKLESFGSPSGKPSKEQKIIQAYLKK